MDTIKKENFHPIKLSKTQKYDFKNKEKNSKLWAIRVANKLIKYNDNRKPTIQMLGRYQPFHEGHLRLFEKSL